MSVIGRVSIYLILPIALGFAVGCGDHEVAGNQLHGTPEEGDATVIQMRDIFTGASPIVSEDTVRSLQDRTYDCKAHDARSQHAVDHGNHNHSWSTSLVDAGSGSFAWSNDPWQGRVWFDGSLGLQKEANLVPFTDCLTSYANFIYRLTAAGDVIAEATIVRTSNNCGNRSLPTWQNKTTSIAYAGKEVSIYILCKKQLTRTERALELEKEIEKTHQKPQPQPPPIEEPIVY